ncbi:hypothetical protein H8N03_13975 [Ramlibacter sp. USB13]|uniref:SCO family protein n=1 Tax=Ramlibacter cellulosilyticus TaxID=2764187 RepID=A0A923MRC1_9BURK|nr:hypothetical protein [Ramlibacter cellulosilyticus]MBC5784055.1 hypothetical protein [Ramlibacter cellulosilyticus]
MKAWTGALLLAFGTAAAQPIPSPAGVSLDQRIGKPLPLTTQVRDARGHAAHLSDFFAARTPVLLVLGYYRCPQLCGLVMHSLLEGLHRTGLPAAQWRIVGLSLAPDEGPEDAARRSEQDLAYARWLQDGGVLPRLDLLVAAPDDVHRIADAAGLRYAPRDDGISHPATVVLLTPEGRVARYFNGVGLDAPQLRDALVQAREGRLGTWSERLALLCSHLDPGRGRHTGAVMAALRLTGIAALALWAALAWRQSRRRQR